MGAGIVSEGYGEATLSPPVLLGSCRWEEELAKRMNLQTMVDTLQEVSTSEVPTKRGLWEPHG